MKSVVLDGYAVNPGDLSWDFFSEFGAFTVYDQTDESETAEKIGDAEIILTNRIHITNEILDRCPNVRYITSLGTGYDMINLEACRERGIEVCNVPGYSTDSVAQLAFSLILSLAFDLNGFRNIVKSGKWTGIPGVEYQKIKCSELAGKTVGIYGCGTIGQRLGKMCLAFGMKVLGYRRSLTQGTVDGIEYVNREKIVSESDFISFHCPLTESTKNLVNSEFISHMKRGACIVNTSRGAVINEADLAEALHSGFISGAALDVMCKEPPDKNNPLFAEPNCIITPHCAWVTPEARKRLLNIIALNIRSFIRTGKGINRVL